jgi:hypothetical protein
LVDFFLRIFIESWPVLRTTFRVTGGYKKAGTSSPKGLLEGFSQLVSNFTDASTNFFLDFLHKKTAKNSENHKRSFKKIFFDF